MSLYVVDTGLMPFVREVLEYDVSDAEKVEMIEWVTKAHGAVADMSANAEFLPLMLVGMGNDPFVALLYPPRGVERSLNYFRRRLEAMERNRGIAGSFFLQHRWRPAPDRSRSELLHVFEVDE